MNAAEDQAAVEKVLAGDRSAFEGLVRRWQGPLVNLAYRFCRDRGRAEEMAQEAFLKAWRRLDDLSQAGSFASWLCGIVRNLCVDQKRRKRGGEGRCGRNPGRKGSAARLTPGDQRLG